MAIEIELEKPQIAKQFDERKLRSTLSLIVCLALGLPLLLSGIGHLANTHIFLDSLYRYQLLPNGIVPYVASVLPALTAVTGGALILGQFTRASLFFCGDAVRMFCLCAIDPTRFYGKAHRLRMFRLASTSDQFLERCSLDPGFFNRVFCFIYAFLEYSSSESITWNPTSHQSKGLSC